MENNKKIMSLKKVIKRRLKTAKEKNTDLEIFINDGTASNMQKQQYLVHQTEVRVYEELSDILEGLEDSENESKKTIEQLAQETAIAFGISYEQALGNLRTLEGSLGEESKK
jgi:phage terminase small subunit